MLIAKTSLEMKGWEFAIKNTKMQILKNSQPVVFLQNFKIEIHLLPI